MSASGSTSDIVQVLTLYSDGTCSGTPLNVQMAPYAECYSDTNMDSSWCNGTSVGSSIYYYTFSCTSDRHETVQTLFGSQDFFGYDIYYDNECSSYDSSNVYLAVGTCQTGFSNESARAALYDDGSAELEVYWNNSDCSSVPNVFESSKENLTSAACMTYGTENGFVYFSSASLEGSSSTASSSSSASGTPAPVTTGSDSGMSSGVVIGIVVGVVVVVLIIAVFLFWYCRRKHKYHAADNQEALLDPTTGKVGSTIPTIGTAAWIPSGEGGAALWEDEAIISSRIPREKVVIEALLSRGGYGEVYKGTYNGQDVAIKMLLPETRRSLKHVNAFLAETKMIAALEHSRIVQFIGVAWDSLNDLCVLSEYMDGGDLRALLVHYEETNHAQGFDHDKVKIALHVAHALTYLHTLEQPIIHRDLKSKNVLLTQQLDAKLTDFGISREREDRTMTAGVGTSLWMAPEVMMGDKYDVKADMFSFGVMLSELDLHSLPYSHAKENSNTGRKMPDAAILQMVAMGTLRVAFSPGSLPAMVDLGLACVATDPKDRPTAAEATYKLQTILREL